MPSDEDDVLAKIAAGGDNGVFAFMQMARRFYERDGQQGVTGFVERAFPTMPQEAQTSAMAVSLVELFRTTRKNWN